MDIVRQSGITDGIPLFIAYWPDKEVHHFITSRKEVEALLPDNPRLDEVFARHKNFLGQEEAKALKYLKHLSKIATERMGNGRCPNPWPLISAQETTIWEPQEYAKYKGLLRLYSLNIKHRLNAFRQCEELGRKLLLIEERQERRIQRVGQANLLRKANFTEKYERIVLSVNGTSPTNEEMENAWDIFERTGYYAFTPTGSDRVYHVRL